MSEFRLRKIWNLDWKVSVVDKRILRSWSLHIDLYLSAFDENKMYKSENNFKVVIIDDQNLPTFSLKIF